MKKTTSHGMLIIFTLALLSLFSFSALAQEAPAENPAPAAGDSPGADTSTIGNDMYEADYFTGAATKRIGLALPPGRAGIAPDLVLSYNSHRRDPSSHVGFGWELNPGYIERGASGGLNYTGEDFIYVVNGQRTQLVSLSSTIINGCQEFRAKVDDTDAVRYFKCDNGWRVYGKDGVAHILGSGRASRIENLGGDKIFRWYLDRVVDLNGNSYNVTYASDMNRNLNTWLRIDNLYYTSHPQGGSSSFRVSFVYDNGGYEIDFPANYAANGGKVLKVIEVRDGTRLIKKYELEYKFGIGTMPLLKALHSKGYDGTQEVELPTQEFDYSDLTAPAKMWGDYMETTVSLGDDASLYDEEHSYLDINGDGYIDRIVGRPGENRFDAYYGSSTGFSNSPVSWEDKWDVNGLKGRVRGEYYDYHYAYIKDLNGDGLPDRIYGSKNFGGWGDGFLVFLNNGDQWTYSTFMSDPLCPADPAGTNVNCGKISGEAGLEDMNGDDLPDRTIWHNRKLYVYYNRGHSFVSSADEWDDPLTPWPGGGYTAFLKDMNGDGLVDRVERGGYDDLGNTVYGFKIYMSHGRGWYTEDQYFLPDPDQGAQAQLNETADLIDLNRDGLPDRVVVKPDENKIYIYWNQGKKFSAATVVDDPVGANAGRSNYDNLPGFMDFNGDGYLDRVGKYDGSASIKFAKFRPTYGSGLYLLGRINNGLGVTSGIQYREAAMFANRLLPMPLHVVTNVVLEEGSERKDKEIKYAGGYFYPDYYNPLGRRFNGFHYVEIRDSLGNVDQRWYKQAHDNIITGRMFFVPDHVPTGNFSIPTEGMNGRAAWELPGNPFDFVEQSGRIYHEAKYFNPNDGSGLKKLSSLDQRWESFDANNRKNRHVYLAEQNSSDCLDSACRTRHKEWYYYENDYNFSVREMRDIGEAGVDTPIITKYNDYLTVNVPDIGLLVTSKPVVVELWDSSSMKNKTALLYDAKGNVLTKTETLINGSGQRDITSSYTYDAVGNILTKTDPLGRVVTFTYDNTYRTYPVSEGIRVDGWLFETRREFDGRFGKPTSVEPPDGRATTYLYDPFGRLKEKKFNGRWVEKYEYVDKIPRPNSSGLFLSVVKKFTNINSDPASASSPREVVYRDGQGRVVQNSARSEMSNGQWRTQYTSYQQSAIVNRTMTSQPAFTASDAFAGSFPAPYIMKDLDSAGRVIKIQPPAGDAGSPAAPTVIKYGDGADPWTTVSTDEIGSVKKESRDSRGRITKVIEVLGSGRENKAEYFYNFHGKIVLMRDTSGNITTYSYDNFGRRTRENHPDRGIWSYKYDDVGNPVEQTDARGVKTTFTYDDLNRVKTRNASNGTTSETITYTYDRGDGGFNVKQGELYQIEDVNGYARFSYNSWGGIEKTERTIEGLSGSAVTQYSRDPDGRVLEMKYPKEKLYLKYVYDVGGRVKSVKRVTASGEEEIYQIPEGAYDRAGHLLQVNYGNGVRDEFGYYNGSLRQSSTRTVRSISGAASETLRQLSYKYNASADVIEIGDGQNTNIHDAGIKGITYDSLHRITGYNHNQGASTGATNDTYSYDLAGNMLSNSESHGTSAYTYNVSGHSHALGSIGSANFTYDANGNMTFGRGRNLEYNLSNQLSRVALENGVAVNYGFAGTGERLFKKVNQGATSIDTYYIGDYMEVKNGELVHNVYVEGNLIAVISDGKWNEQAQPPSERSRYEFPSDADDTWPENDSGYFYYIHTDHLKSSNMMTEGKPKAVHNGIRYVKGEIVQRVEYTPFGRERYVLNAQEDGPKFTDQVYDIETGLYYYKARYYDAVVGRFIQPDSAMPNITTPQDLNPYAYVHNRPLVYVDPTGHYVDKYNEDDDTMDDVGDPVNDVFGAENGTTSTDSGGGDIKFSYEDGQFVYDSPLEGPKLDLTWDTKNHDWIDVKDGVDVSELRSSVSRTYSDIRSVWSENDERATITSTYDSKQHLTNSKHYTNEALDIRANQISDDKAESMARQLQSRVGSDYDVGFETFPDTPERDHIHMEYDPKRKK